MTPRFSVLVPTYNHGRFVGAALDSLIAQTCGDWEALVVNDGSTDNTVQVLSEYAQRDSRIRVFHKDNGGCASALNVGLAQARGEWILWLSADDTFEPGKLAAHLRGFVRHPVVRLFHTHFYSHDHAVGQTTAPDHWRRQPEPRWQVLEMLESIYIQPLSMCVHRGCFVGVDVFDETLRFSQDYDILLRLVAKYQAVYLDERTCCVGHHPGQGTNVHGATNLFIDDGKSVVNFLNRTRFEDLFPLMDLTDMRQANQALDHAMDAAANQHAFLYKAGAHPALLSRIMEWVFDAERGRMASELRRFFCRRAAAAARQHAGTTLGTFWSAAAAIARTVRDGVPGYRTIDPADVIETEAHQLRARGGPEWETYAGYLARFEGRTVFTDTKPRLGPARTVTFAAAEGTELAARSVYGAMRMTVEMARQMVRTGRQAIVFGLSKEGLGWFQGVPCMGAKDDISLKRLIRAFDGQDAFVSVGRSDTLLWSRSPRLLVYHHTTHRIPGGLTPRAMNRIGAHVVAVSRYSAGQLTGAGHRNDLVHLVPNAYDHVIFHMGDVRREPWRILFAGGLCQYKGFDIALQAFKQLKAVEPSATLIVCGEELPPWRQDAVDDCMSPRWVNTDGTLNWNAIGLDVPGVKYRGHKDPLALSGEMREAGFLVLPSRYGENFPLVSLEVQACGCWPVLPRHLALPETIQDGETGSLYEPNTPDGLAAVVVRLWETGMPSEGQRLKAAERVRESFSFEKSGEEFMKVLDAVPEIGRWNKAIRAGSHAIEAARWRAGRLCDTFCRKRR